MCPLGCYHYTGSLIATPELRHKMYGYIHVLVGRVAPLSQQSG